MVLSRHQIFSLITACSVSSIAIGWSGMTAEAGSATGTASVTIQAAGGVGTSPDPDTTPVTTAPIVVTPTSSTTVSGFTIPTPPTPTATSSLGFSPVAPVGGTGTTTPATGSGSSSSTGTNSDGTPAPRFSNPNVSSAGLGSASGVAVAGSPNQAYSVILPELTMYTSSGQLVTLSNFQHTAGSTPFLGNDGAAFFNIGAQVNQAPMTADIPRTSQDDDQNAAQQQELPAALQLITSSIADATLIGSDRATVLAAAFSSRSPYVNIVVSYN